MSGVYIKGMEMPRNCGECPLSGDWYCNALPSIPAWHKEYVSSLTAKTRMDRCPLIPVPEHGTLIDADGEIEVSIKMMPVGKCDIDLISPVIIPADKEGER